MLTYCWHRFFIDAYSLPEQESQGFENEGTAFNYNIQFIYILAYKFPKQFKKEEKINGGLINKALLHPKLFNIDELRDDFKKEDIEMENRKKCWEAAKQKRIEDKK